MTLSSDIKSIDVEVYHVNVHIKINSPQPIFCNKCSLKSICIVTLTTDFEGQDNILFPMIDYVGVAPPPPPRCQINSLVGLLIVKYHY